MSVGMKYVYLRIVIPLAKTKSFTVLQMNLLWFASATRPRLTNALDCDKFTHVWRLSIVLQVADSKVMDHQPTDCKVEPYIDEME